MHIIVVYLVLFANHIKSIDWLTVSWAAQCSISQDKAVAAICPLKSRNSDCPLPITSNFSYLGDLVRWWFFSKLLIEMMSLSSSIFVLYSSEGGQYQLNYLAPSTSTARLQLINATNKYANPDSTSHIPYYTFHIIYGPYMILYLIIPYMNHII